MKDLSESQKVLASAFTVVGAVALIWAFGLIEQPGDAEREASGEVSARTSADLIRPAELTQREAESALAAEQVQFTDDAGPSSITVTRSGPSADELENALVYRSRNEAVVNITAVSLSYGWFMQPVPQEGTGSGSILDQKGRVLTNYHVIEGAQDLTVTLADGSEYEAEVVGTDPENDLAIIRFDPKGKKLVTIPLGTSENLFVGMKVLAIGNPFGLDRTLTTGIVSGLGRPIQTEDGLIIQEMIQTDASINPGNSGGPLLNADGELIGVNTMIYSPSGGSVGVGFAVPADTVNRVIPDLIAYGEVRRGWIDITPIQLFSQLVSYADLPVERGILVSEVEPGSPAEKAGLRGGSKSDPVRAGRTTIYLGGDIIVEIDGTEVAAMADLYTALEDNRPGETVSVTVIRGKSRRTLRVTLSERE
jgi:S1-C subfamily serine protease